ncbi:MAG: hypothetical protein MJA30_14100, partial [Cytophagales bacterium]|nr:hypothetical protein [Cytophagales bacterium]
LTCCGDGFVPPSTLTASLAKTIRFLFCHPNSKHFRENGTTRHDDPFFCLSTPLQALCKMYLFAMTKEQRYVIGRLA